MGIEVRADHVVVDAINGRGGGGWTLSALLRGRQ
jgi:hypothetical protein